MNFFKPVSMAGKPSPVEPASPVAPTRGTLRQTLPSRVAPDNVRHPAPPSAYVGLVSEPGISIRQEQNTAPQVEGSDPLLRSLSPFMLRMELPLVYGEGVGFGEQAINQISVDALTVASQGGGTRYESARRSVSQSGVGDGRRSPTDPKLAKQVRSGGKLGEPAITDFMVAKDIHTQLKAILNAPPLVLLINPTSMTTSYTKILQYTERSRYGYILHNHGEEQTRLSFTAKCGAFYSGGRGVSVASRQDSVAWQNMMNLFTFYKHNGYIQDTVNNSKAHHLVGSISIHYDQWIYYGSMEKFSWTFDESNQLGGMEFQIDFVASAITDTSQATEVVRPMRSPTPNPGDPRYSGFRNQSQNQAGEFSVGLSFGRDGLAMTQSRVMGVDDVGRALGTLVPGSQTDPTTIGTLTQSTGERGFRGMSTSTRPGERAITVANPRAVSPFGR